MRYGKWQNLKYKKIRNTLTVRKPLPRESSQSAFLEDKTKNLEADSLHE